MDETKFKLVSSKEPGILQLKQVDWNICFICQEESKPADLISPARNSNKRSKP